MPFLGQKSLHVSTFTDNWHIIPKNSDYIIAQKNGVVKENRQKGAKIGILFVGGAAVREN
ncbi:MAG: hypothetical protein LUG52_00705 [Clostridia bacterium]|nr:hypothetical protein [Clostridia bacterium]